MGNIIEIESKLKEFFKLLYPALYKIEYSISNGLDERRAIDSANVTENGNTSFENTNDIFSEPDILTPDEMKPSSDCISSLSYDSSIRNGKSGNGDFEMASNVNGDVSLQNLSNAIQNRKKISESNSSPGSGNKISKSSLLSSISKVNDLVQKLLEINEGRLNERNTQKVSQSDPTKHHQIEQDSTIFEANGVDKKHEDEIMELKAKFLRHKEILKFNCDEAESEVIRLDEIYHDTVDMVLKAFNSIPEIVESNAELLKIKTSLESSLLEAQQESASVKQTVDGPIK